MHDLTLEGAAAHGEVLDRATLTGIVIEAVQTVSGVTRLEPALLGRLSRRGAPVIRKQLAIGGQGVDLDLVGSSASVSVDVAVSIARPVLETARDVQAAVVAALETNNVRCASVIVSVLALDS